MSTRQGKIPGAESEHFTSASDFINKNRPPITPYAQTRLMGFDVDAFVSDMLHQLQTVSASLADSPRQRPREPVNLPKQPNVDHREFLRRSAEISRVAQSEVPSMHPELARILKGFDPRLEPRSHVARPAGNGSRIQPLDPYAANTPGARAPASGQ